MKPSEIVDSFIESLPADAPAELRNWSLPDSSGYFPSTEVVLRGIVKDLARDHIAVTWKIGMSWADFISDNTYEGMQQKIADVLGVPVKVLSGPNKMLTYTQFYELVYNVLMEQTSIAFGEPKYTRRDYDTITSCVGKLFESDVAGMFTRGIFDIEFIEAIDHCLCSTGNLWFKINSTHLFASIDSLWQEYIRSPELDNCSQEDFRLYLKLRIAALSASVDVLDRGTMSNAFAERLSACTPEHVISSCLTALCKYKTTPYLLTAWEVARTNGVAVPWMCLHESIDSKSVHKALVGKPEYFDTLSRLYENKGLVAVVNEVLRVSACMPTSAWSGNYVNAFTDTWCALNRFK